MKNCSIVWCPNGLRAVVPSGTPFLTTIRIESGEYYDDEWRSVTLDGHDEDGRTTFRLEVMTHTNKFRRVELFIWENSDEFLYWEAEVEEYDTFAQAWRRARELECYLHQLSAAGLL